ncbi:Dpy-30 motif [Carpediemonas membranifera]|uniref:Protein dpy-30 homolog n=1 Tax=Carpediemonas membranifera TaxID=201153 RepID=A0A8J6E6K5_9EUKA|nr:Dpy-30 motif [Carpediemonas membranifera]|eukprot:KAG9397222.1 Dpy-30 motif [Carpediemonas membranifera]
MAEEERPGENEIVPQTEVADANENTASSQLNLQVLPTRTYLDQTVVPVLLQGLSALVQERPPNPIEYLAAFLMRHSDQTKKEEVHDDEPSDDEEADAADEKIAE